MNTVLLLIIFSGVWFTLSFIFWNSCIKSHTLLTFLYAIFAIPYRLPKSMVTTIRRIKLNRQEVLYTNIKADISILVIQILCIVGFYMPALLLIFVA